jgi:hypothetical protein
LRLSQSGRIGNLAPPKARAAAVREISSISNLKEKIMTPIAPHFGVNRRVLLSTLALLPAFQPQAAMAQQAPPAASSVFSFAAYGDSRPMMYLPVKDGQRDLTKLFVEMFGLVMPRKIAEAVVKRDVKMIYDPVATIPGIGVLGASAITATVTDPNAFRSGRDFAAWIGLVPHRMPSRAAAVRELLRYGLAAQGAAVENSGIKSREYGVLRPPKSQRKYT